MSGLKRELVECEVEPKTFLIQHMMGRYVRRYLSNPDFDGKSQNH